jgi:hypothetical protein
MVRRLWVPPAWVKHAPAAPVGAPGGARGEKESTGRVVAFAGAMAARYAPAPVFVLDVGETEAGLRVVETNCFNSAGWYACDAAAIVRRVTAFVRAM